MNEIKIPKENMEKTLQACQQELQIALKQKTPHFTLMWNIFNQDLKMILLYACVGFVLLSMCAMQYPDQRMVLYGIYFGFLGFLGVYEAFRQKLYHTEELIHVCPINNAKLFLYKSILCSIFDSLILWILCFMESQMGQQYLPLLLSTLVPLLISQVLCMVLDLYLKNSFSTLLCFMLFYSLYEIFYIRFARILHRMLSWQTIGFLLFFCILLYMALLTSCYQKNRKEVTSWN